MVPQGSPKRLTVSTFQIRMRFWHPTGDHAVLELRVEERSASYSNRIVKLYIPIEHNPFSVDPAAWGGTSTTVSPEGGRMI